jgi:F0F1-type ATP synthase beta subunit
VVFLGAGTLLHSQDKQIVMCVRRLDEFAMARMRVAVKLTNMAGKRVDPGFEALDKRF